MPVCRQLTKEFRSEYPMSYFKADKIQKGDTVSHFVYLWTEGRSIWVTTIGDKNAEINESQLNESLSLWAKELFVEQYPYMVYITLSDDSAYCTFTNQKYTDEVNIALPSRLLHHGFLFATLHLPFGNYLLNKSDEWEKAD